MVIWFVTIVVGASTDLRDLGAYWSIYDHFYVEQLASMVNVLKLPLSVWNTARNTCAEHPEDKHFHTPNVRRPQRRSPAPY